MAKSLQYMVNPICYAALFPLDCTGRPMDLATGQAIDPGDPVKLWGPNPDQLTAYMSKCNFRDLTLTPKVSDDIIYGEGQCDETVYPGEYNGHTGSMTRTMFESAGGFEIVIGDSQTYYDSTTGLPALSLTTESVNTCACGANCLRDSFAMMVWQQMVEACDPVGRLRPQILNDKGEPLWRIQLYPQIRAKRADIVKAFDKSKVTEDRTIEITADYNPNFPFAKLAVPTLGSPGSYTSLLNGNPLANYSGSTPTTIEQIHANAGSDITFYAPVPPPTLRCGDNCSGWYSNGEGPAIAKAVEAAAVKPSAK